MFAKAGSSTEPAPLSMPKLVNHSKLASANITDLMTETNDQFSSNPAWSGKRQVTISQELFDALEDSKPEAKTGGKDCLPLAFDVKKEMGKVSEIIKSRGNVNMGTVSWRTVAGATTKRGEDDADA